MAARAFNMLQALGKEYKLLAGRFRPNGAGAIDNTLNKGVGFSVARANTGLYTVTLEDGYVDFVVIIGGVQLNAAAAGLVEVLGAPDVASAKTFQLQYMQEAASTFAAADIASNVNNWVHFLALLRNSELGK